MSIYVWTLGETALARVCKKVYAKVKITKNEDGVFHDEKVLGISPNEDGTLNVTRQLCYYVEIIRSGQKLWLPYTSLHLAERGRPFYGTDKVSTPKPAVPAIPRKRKIKEDQAFTFNIKQNKRDPELNAAPEVLSTPLNQIKSENAFQAFVRRGKDMLFDQFYSLMEDDENCSIQKLDYLKNVDASTEDKFETVIQNVVTKKEIDNYLHQCWRYYYVCDQDQTDAKDGSDSSNPPSPTKAPITVHATWCLVCGKTGKLRECPNCPAVFHLACRKDWLLTIIHRKKPPSKPQRTTTFVEKILSSTRTICSVNKDKERVELCPSCMWGPKVGYDDVVWHKLGTCSWWPARVLTPGATPSCLLSRSHAPHQWPLRYYGTLNHSWGESSRMCLLLPSHTAVLESRCDPALKQGLMDACDDYIAVYLT